MAADAARSGGPATDDSHTGASHLRLLIQAQPPPTRADRGNAAPCGVARQAGSDGSDIATTRPSVQAKSLTDDATAVPGPDVAPNGSGYRAVIESDGQVIWSCPHVHFTEHSARNCRTAARQLAASA